MVELHLAKVDVAGSSPVSRSYDEAIWSTIRIAFCLKYPLNEEVPEVIVNKNVELLEDSAVKLTITVNKDSIQKEYDELVKNYGKAVQIKGFRKGRVPADILIRKFSSALISETAEKIIKDSLNEALDSVDKKRLRFSTPEVSSEDTLKLGKDFTFTVSYDTYPEVELPEYRGLEYEELRVKLTEEDLERELKNLQEQNSLVTDKEEGRVEKGNIVNIDYVELDSNDQEKEGSRRESFVFEEGTGYNPYKIDEDILGMQKDEEKIIKKSFPEDFEIKELAGREVELKVKINNIKEKQLPEINDELAQDISDKYKTLEDLKKDILLKQNDLISQKVRENNISQLLEKVTAGSKISLPKSLVEEELNQQWNNFVARFRTDEKIVIQKLESEGKTKEDLLADWRPSIERRLKLQLTVAKMIEKEKLQAGDEDVNNQIQKEADLGNMSFEEVKEQMNNHLDVLKHDIKKEKLYDLLLESAAGNKGKEIKFLDLARGNY